MKRYSPVFSLQNDQILKKRRLRRLIALALSVLALGGIALAFPRMLAAFEKASGGSAKIASLEDVAALWELRDTKAVEEACARALASSPASAGHMAFLGLARFYQCLSETDAERRALLLEETVFSLRKALPDCPEVLKVPVQYTLGKAYFHKGQDYYPESMYYLSLVAKDGIGGFDDAWEYMALAAQSLGQFTESTDYFERAMRVNASSSELKAAAARAYLTLDKLEAAERLALEARDMSQDAYVRERCAFIIAEIYLRQKRYDEALQLYADIKNDNPESADAWFYEGIVYADTGDAIKARASWRKAVSIDPMHAGARQKLAERS